MRGTSNNDMSDDTRKRSDDEDDYHVQEITRIAHPQAQQQKDTYAVLRNRTTTKKYTEKKMIQTSQCVKCVLEENVDKSQTVTISMMKDGFSLSANDLTTYLER